MSTAKQNQTERNAAVDSDLQGRIFTIRGEKVILDSDLADIYGVEVRTRNQQVKRNTDRFPEDFSFTLTKIEWEAVEALRSQNVILKRGSHRKYPPRVFTEHGALMAVNSTPTGAFRPAATTPTQNRLQCKRPPRQIRNPAQKGNIIMQQPIITLVDQILTTKRATPAAGITPLETHVDTLVAALYGVENSPC